MVKRKLKTFRESCNATITKVLNTSGANYKINEVESIFFLNTIKCTEKEGREKYGFRTTKHPTHTKEMDKFEAEMIGMVKEIKFRKMRNNIQQKMYENMRRFKESESIFVKSDKSGNLYEIEKGKYK